jgi:hypothetical protein
MRATASTRNRLVWRSSAAAALAAGAALVACSGDPIGGGSGGGGDPANRPDSQSMGRWTPSTDSAKHPNECSQAIHDSFYVVGPDGRKYPTWHPPRDPATGCWFGHEHGENPANSALWNDLRRHFAWDANGNGTIEDTEAFSTRSGIPFGYAAEYGGAPAAILHDSYKIAFVDGLARPRLVNGTATDAGLRCNHLVAWSQDTQTARPFNEALHPLIYAADCTGSGESANYPGKLILSVMADYGSTAAVPARTGEAPAARLFPEAGTQVFPSAFVAAGATSDLPAALLERWDTIVSLRTTGGTELARINPGVEHRTPSRFRDAGSALWSLDLCYGGLDALGRFVNDPAQAASIVRQVRGSATDCARLPRTGPATPVSQRVTVDALDAQFKGCNRQLVLRNQAIANGTGPTTWYSAPGGTDARTQPFAGSLRQFVAAGVSNTNFTLASVTDDATVDCDGAATGVHVRR